MAIRNAVEAYRQSAYQGLEYRIATSTGAAGMPIVGGLFANLKSIGNSMYRPIKVGKALIAGGEYPVDSNHVVEAQIPQDIANSHYGEALVRMREYGRSSADMRAESVGKFMEGDFGGGFRQRRAASYNDNQQRGVILPDEGRGPVGNILSTGASLAGAVMSVRGDSGSPLLASLGNFAAPALPFNLASLAPRLG